MSCSLSLTTTRGALQPSFFTYKSRLPSLFITSKLTQQPNYKPNKKLLLLNRIASKKPTINYLWPENSSLPIQIGALITLVEQPALAVTGVNNEEELSWVLIQLGIIAFWYFLIMPPIMLNWLRTRWYKRKFVEMYLQFMCVFMFFPGILLWAPFVNFRQLPRDPTMKYPWSTPQDPSLTDSTTSK